MSREILILWAGRHRRETWEELCADYRRRIVRVVPVRDEMVKVRRSGDGPARRKAEGRALVAALPDPCWTVALDPRGKTASSAELADKLRRLGEEWPHAVVFVIGSDLGLDPVLLEAARERLSLGPMVFGHELARLVLYEQLYRAICIQRGIKYYRQPF